MKPFRIILIVDDQDVCHVLLQRLIHSGYEVRKAETGRSALELLQKEVFDAALVDSHLTDMTGVQVLNELKRRDPELDAILMTGSQIESDVEALRLGAYDCLTKPVDWTSLERVLHRVIERRYLRDEVISLRKRLAEIPGSGEFIGMSGSIQHVRDVVARVAPTDLVVLIEGESGTGKELIAYGIHSISLRKKRPFIPVNCAAIPPELIESEFFGHVKGGSSSVTSDSRGLFRTAEGGTLFLDEVAQLPMSIQPKLLRALEEKEVRAVGSAQAHQVDVRIIAATNQDLQAAVNAGRFRQDLFYRLSVVKIEAPPLRSIKEDISLIATHYVRRLNRRFARNVRNIAPDAMASLTGYNFPGNVRELENIIERAYALGVDDEIKLCDLPTLAPVAQSMWSEPSRRTLEAFERDLVAQTLRTHRNDKSKAAAALGMSERTLYRRMKKHGISQQSWGSHP